MGAIVEQLGYTLMWSAGSCKLLHPDGRKLKLRVRNGCPELVQSKALELISRLEERKLAEIEQLKRHTEEGRDRIRQARIALEKSWWEHLMDYARDGVSCSGDAAVANAPFFTDVPRCALRGLVPSGDAGDESLWDMLRSALPNLNRRRRKALQQSRHWLVHLFAGVTHPDVYCLSADVAGPIRVPAKDPEGRSKHPPVFRYFLAASYRFPKLQGTKDEPNPTQVDGFDDPLLHPGGEDELADVVVEGPPEPEHRPDGKDVLPEEEHPWERAKCEFEAPPGLARLVFVVPLHTNKSEAVLEALQQVFLELRSLNLPVLRFHSDRSREFFNKRTRAWFHEHGVRTTTAEGDTPQQNGAAENTIRWLKARARTLLAQAEVGTELWACAMATAASQQRAQQLGLKSKLAAPFGAPCSVKLKFYGPSRGDLGDRWVDGKYMGLSPSVNDSRQGVCVGSPSQRLASHLCRRLLFHRRKVSACPHLQVALDSVGSQALQLASLCCSHCLTVSVRLSNVKPLRHHECNKLLPLAHRADGRDAPVRKSRGGDLWVELRAGDVIYGSVEQRVDGAGKKWLGTTHSLQRGERVVLVAYTVNTLGKVSESELQALESLGFPLPASARLPLTTQQDVRRLDVFDMFEEGPLELAGEDCPKKVEKGGGWKETQKVEAGTVELEVSWNLKHTPAQREQTPCVLQTLEPKPHAQVEEESWPEQPVQWELWLPDPQSGQQLCALRSDDLDLRLCKSEPVYTPDIEQLLSGLTEPLQIVHTVDPREAEKHSEVWIPSILKEIGVIEKAVHRLPPSEVRKGNWLHRTDVRVVPAKLVFTVKPPDVQPTAPGNGEHATQASLFKRKARLVACGNHAPSTGTEIYASGAAAESLRCLVVISSKRGWMLGILDVTSAFLLTPIPQGDGFPVFALTPPRYLVRQGLAQEGELWILTHAVYGLRESPKLWSDFRDSQLLNLRCMANGVELQLLKGKLDTNWWRIVQTSDGQVVGGLITYVDDFLLAGCAAVIEALAKAIQSIWKTTPLTLAYAEELLRLNNVKPTALGKIPCPRDLVSFDTLLTDESPTEESVRTAQRLTGEILWLSQRTRPDLAFTACVLATLSTKAPERAARIAERALAYVQQTKAFALTADADDTGLVAYSDASFAPDGNRSHTGWVVFLYGSPVCWRSARQAFVTLSTAESELVAGLDAVVALQSAEAMLGEFGVFNLGKTLKVDSQSALAIAIGQGSWRTRHLKVRANYLREQYEAGEIIPVFCPGVEQAADLLTKALPAARILELAAIWGLFEHRPEDPRQAEAVAADLPTHPQYPQIKLLFLLLAMMQIQSAKCQPELFDEEEGDVHQVELRTDLMFMLLVGFVGIGFIAVWELAKWCLRHHSLCRIRSTAKQRKLQRLRDRTAQAIEEQELAAYLHSQPPHFHGAQGLPAGGGPGGLGPDPSLGPGAWPGVHGGVGGYGLQGGAFGKGGPPPVNPSGQIPNIGDASGNDVSYMALHL
ncbi:GIP [Symbiodinium natans]|uniref:GIP protein n=1 Tax=Symbiodinium natans TaxID=878477 RepID=A0A812SNK2_9DINO|nr:GIP [Symbiodinium natans]